ncbi:MAG: putative entry exclusion protein TrbK-alt [Sphingopyxis sp.]|uniref:putative entry exclusion protein TrbK-alt n=1 Tax=Sphingopyxis TaxID=165697 RepID=UPI0029394C16|nr:MULTISPECIES: putative entry exclusion protein TrbK-alt [Sphingopyxis]MDZ3833180.1 putative entry exclusion protein TrbK-alt [Sphingopyxis sp.]WOF45819.1 putative entry exclusion protein TrbK-alt [Sphingopyxis indica]
MGRTGKLVVGAVIGGMALALVLMAAVDPPAPRASAPPQISGADARPDLDEMLRRCRTVTVADPECEAAWETKRRRFFGQEKDER